MRSSVERSYLGIGSCAVFAMAVVAMLASDVLRPDQIKLDVLPLLVVAPLVGLLHMIGIAFGIQGLSQRDRNPGSRWGLILNSAAPALWLLSLMVAQLC